MPKNPKVPKVLKAHSKQCGPPLVGAARRLCRSVRLLHQHLDGGVALAAYIDAGSHVAGAYLHAVQVVVLHGCVLVGGDAGYARSALILACNQVAVLGLEAEGCALQFELNRVLGAGHNHRTHSAVLVYKQLHGLGGGELGACGHIVIFLQEDRQVGRAVDGRTAAS